VGTRENKFKSSEKLCKPARNFFISYILPVLSSVSYEVPNLFSIFGVVRNDFFKADLFKNSRTEVSQTN